MRPTQAIVDLSNLRFNYLNIRKKVSGSRVMAVVKADAYGHGMAECVKALNQLAEKSPEYYAVALLEEAVQLRKTEKKKPVLVFAPVGKGEAPEFKKHNITATIFEDIHLKYLRQADSGGRKIRVHIKIDTGMGRLGVSYAEAVRFIEKVSRDSRFVIDGIYTHFATSDEKDKTFARLQLERFKGIISELKEKGIDYGLAHCANSGAILDLPDSYFDMVRPGIALYGYYPSLETSESIKLKPVMALISEITNIKEIGPGDSVSYGRKYIAGKKTKIASVPIGYADGYVRGMSTRAEAIIGGKKYKQAGQICMDRIMFDVENSRIKPGDKIVLLGKMGKAEINAWDWSRLLGTIPYEITCNISKRVPRKYLG